MKRLNVPIPQISLLALLCLTAVTLTAQKPLDHDAFGFWRTIEQVQLSPDGRFTSYELQAEQEDPILVLYDAVTETEMRFPRCGGASFSADNTHFAFLRSPGRDTLRFFKQRKKKKKEWPGDTLVVHHLGTGERFELPAVDRYVLSDEWHGWLLYSLRPGAAVPDSAFVKKEKEDTGGRLIVRELGSGAEDTLFFVKKWQLSKERPYLSYHGAGGPDSTHPTGVFIRDLEADRERCVDTGHMAVAQWNWHDSLALFTWIRRPDTASKDERAYSIYMSGDFGAQKPVADSAWTGMPDGWRVSPDEKPEFSGNGQALFFGTAPVPPSRDTTIIDEEWPEVEVWHSEDQVLYTQQVNRLKDEKKRSYLCKYDIGNNALVQLGRVDLPEVETANEGNNRYALGLDDRLYQKFITWEGHDYKDLYLVDTEDGRIKPLVLKVYGNPRWSPAGKYIYWYQPFDSTWVIMDPFAMKTRRYGQQQGLHAADEVHDVPAFPGSYGSPGWLEDDAAMLVYDRYDIWQLNPSEQTEPVALTDGRLGHERLRLVRLDPEARFWTEGEDWLVHRFSETTKESGYALLNKAEGTYGLLLNSPHRYATRVWMADDSDVVLFTRENFQQFPELHRATFPALPNFEVISHANPQQEDYAWGTIQHLTWDGPYGFPVEGLLVLPANFDSTATYPLIVNFYEKSADGLHTHRHPYAHRSTINYAFYASCGYAIFNPDIHYREGDPGESALECVMSGLDHILPMGFVDTNRIGLQGHSWGGYQIAHIITKTNKFRCAISGAPVVNMVSAYGGIRWGTGLSRMFQYEKTQSRLGTTLWEDPERYLRNSPIFNIPDIETPVLILHNDEDGAVPWYQGIEFFVALRRLDKKAWLLNYTGEPHWPLRLANRLDYNKRMQQFLDHYLMDAPAPDWMKRGIPAIESAGQLGY
jgi:dipeptidyl aminopeptidase/acylaminoacyl peptidase